MSNILLSIDAGKLGWASGAIFAVIALAVVFSLTIVNSTVAAVGGRRRSQVGAIADSLAQVADDTDPVPPTLTAINDGLTELARVVSDIEQHISVSRLIFDRVAEGQVGSYR